MNRRDTIIIAVLINTGLLAVLFMMAINTENTKTIVQPEAIAMRTSEPVPEPLNATPQKAEQIESPCVRDEIDEVLRHYQPINQSSLVNFESHLEQPQPHKPSAEEYVQVKVKRGDFLDKIARANGTTVETIMAINRMPNERIDIGQVLLIPIAKKPQETQKQRPTTAAASTEPQYYTIKSGDNPWKIAKQFHVRFDDLLSLNNLDEAKARNLKPGDVLRVR